MKPINPILPVTRCYMAIARLLIPGTDRRMMLIKFGDTKNMAQRFKDYPPFGK